MTADGLETEKGGEGEEEDTRILCSLVALGEQVHWA